MVMRREQSNGTSFAFLGLEGKRIAPSSPFPSTGRTVLAHRLPIATDDPLLKILQKYKDEGCERE